MKHYVVKQHISGKYRIMQLFNDVVSFVNTNKKYFKAKKDAVTRIKQLLIQDRHRARLKKRNPQLLVNL